ncbi:hypothetical protein SAMN02745116_01898 [Pilibacter termitis]|uniref:VRR-NUC domain-containing protein n=1 Tax=Pilibacter termitis TaxID=263852 RepID=A0A1T4PQU5_9ENTE|nr:VRR-NUC domain-containing protein [Pilibacter termitis]SJZ94004.1 hypothetical protein SAMN02745116_01898 [Pilibacter termitis]
MREKQVEQQLVQATKAIGGICLKLTSPSMAGIPDRVVLLPNGKIGFVEVKAQKKKPRPLQVYRMKQLTNLGFWCFVLDEIEQIGGILNEIQSA